MKAIAILASPALASNFLLTALQSPFDSFQDKLAEFETYMETDLQEIQDLTNIIANATITTTTLLQSQLSYLETAS